MGKGTIVYLAGIGNLPVEMDVDHAIERSGLDPRWTEVVGPSVGFYNIEEALLALTRRGAKRVELTQAHYDEHHVLHVNTNRTHLTG